MINPKVLKKEIRADILPLDKAVNVAEEKIFMPENRKLKEKSKNPGTAMSYTIVSEPAKSATSRGPKSSEARNMPAELAAMNLRQILQRFFSRRRHRAP